jgi:hypothetical protein
MQKPFEHSLSSDDRATFLGSLWAVIAFYAAVAFISLVLALTVSHSNATDQGPVTSGQLDPLMTGMPLP